MKLRDPDKSAKGAAIAAELRMENGVLRIK
jgi:hypothetical protein